MKNIFSNLGTKKVAGVVLAGATLLVGIGVVNNFSGGSQKAANEGALSRFGESAYNNFMGGSSASRADLERQMSATQAGYGARFLRGRSEGVESDEAFSSDGAYAEGIRGGVGFGRSNDGIYGEDGTYQPINSTYEQGVGGQEFQGYDGKGSGYGDAKFKEAEAAAAAAKGSRSGQGRVGNVRPATQINKLTPSNGLSGGANLGGGMRIGSSFDGGSSSKGGDNNTQVLPRPDAGKGADANAFKLGRAGGMGGFNVGFSGSEAKGRYSKGHGAATDLQVAALYSGKSVASRQEVGSKSLAEAAFDGSNPENVTPTIPEGASIGQVASTLMRGNNLGIDLPAGSEIIPPELEQELEDTAQKAEELAALQRKLTLLKIAMMAGALMFAIGIFFLRKIPIWGPVAAVVVSAAAAVFITGMGLWMKDVVDQMADPKFKEVNQGIDFVGKYTSIITTGASALAMAMYLGWSNRIDKIMEKAKELFVKPTAPKLPGGAREVAKQMEEEIAQEIIKKTGGLH